MEEVWSFAAQPVARRRVFDARIALTVIHHGVMELATRNVADFEGFGLQRVFDPIAPAA